MVKKSFLLVLYVLLCQIVLSSDNGVGVVSRHIDPVVQVPQAVQMEADLANKTLTRAQLLQSLNNGEITVLVQPNMMQTSQFDLQFGDESILQGVPRYTFDEVEAVFGNSSNVSKAVLAVLVRNQKCVLVGQNDYLEQLFSTIPNVLK